MKTKHILLLACLMTVSSFANPMVPFNGQTAVIEVPAREKALTLIHTHLEGEITYHGVSENAITVTLSNDDVAEDVMQMRGYLRYNEENHSVSIQLPPDVLSDTDIYIKGPKSINLKLNNTDGDIEIGDTAGEHEIRSIDGNIILNNVTGGLFIASVDGDINLSNNDLAGLTAIHCNTVDGNLILELPAEINADFQANTIDGDIDLDIEVSNLLNSPPAPVGASLQGTLGEGGIRIQLNTVDGNIIVKTRKS